MAPEVFGVIKAHELGKCRTTKAFSVLEPFAVQKLCSESSILTDIRRWLKPE